MLQTEHLKQRNFIFSQFWRLEIWSECQHAWILVRALFLICRLPSSRYGLSLMCVWRGGERKLPGVSLQRHKLFQIWAPSFQPHLTKITGSSIASDFWAVASGHGKAGVSSAPGHLPTLAPASSRPPSQPLQQGLCLKPWLHVDQHPMTVKV